jgi:hypothetical protein
MSTRVNDPKTTAKVIVMQRCHQQDLSGHLLEQAGWEHLCLPAEYENPGCTTCIGWTEPRTEHGELLWQERFGLREIEALKVSLGSYAAAGQLQQRPSPSGGGIFKRHWFRYFQPRGMSLPPVIVRLLDGTQTSGPPRLAMSTQELTLGHPHPEGELRSPRARGFGWNRGDGGGGPSGSRDGLRRDPNLANATGLHSRACRFRWGGYRASPDWRL